MTSKPLMIGAQSGIITGQSLAFREACAALGGDCVVVDSAFTHVGKMASYLFRLMKGALQSNGTIYFTSSRSRIGFLARDLPIFLLAIATGRRLVNHLHGNDFVLFRESLGWPLRRLLDFCYSHIDLSCTTSKVFFEQYVCYEHMQLRAVPNFFLPEFSNAPFSKSSDGPFEIVYLSNLMFSKGFTLVVQAVKKLLDDGFDVHLTLCGIPLSDSQMSAAEVNAILDSYRNEPFVSVVGPVYGKTKIEALSRAHAFVLPTSYVTEANPISILEALASGCYVVSSPQGAISEMLDGFHAAVQPADVETIAETLRLVENKYRSEKVWEHNRVLAIEKYNLENYHKNIREVVRNEPLHP